MNIRFKTDHTDHTGHDYSRLSLRLVGVCALLITLAACQAESIDQPGVTGSATSLAASDESAGDTESLTDLDALLEGSPDPKTIPDELKADETFPAQFDLVALQSPVKSQGSRGVCSIFSAVALMEHLYIKSGAVAPDYSEQFLQWSVKSELGRFKNTSGSNGSANISALSTYGVVEESAMPYQSFAWNTSHDERCDKEAEKRPMVCFTNGEPSAEVLEARRWKVASSRWVGSSRQNLKAFMHEHNTGVVVGLTFFYQSWNHRKSTLPVSAEYRRQGYVLYPNEVDREKSLEKRAGHSILIVGWDDDLEVPVRDDEGNEVLDDDGNVVMDKGFFLFKNSWGTSAFGTGNPHGPGYGWLSMRYVEEYGSSVSSRPPSEDLTERCDDGLDNNFDGATDCDDSACNSAAVCQEAPEPDLSFDITQEEERALPDQGEITSSLVIEREGTLEQLSVMIELEHTFNGDLGLTLTSPSGQRFTLLEPDSERNEAHLKLELDLEEARGEWIGGEWTLTITDHYERDTGLLVRWSLTGLISGVALNDVHEVNDAPRLEIPDNDPEGVETSLDVTATGRLESLTVWAKIEHTYRGDLIVRLIHPSGAQVTLFEREGRNATDLDLTRAVPELVGLESAGEWLLQVIDLGRGDSGEIVEWGLNLVLPSSSDPERP